MDALVIVGSDLTVNSSANLCHKTYIQGLLNKGYDVDVVTVGNKISKNDFKLNEYEKLSIFSYPMESAYEKIARIVYGNRKQTEKNNDNSSGMPNSKTSKGLLHTIKRCVHYMYGPYEVYISWKKVALQFRSKKNYDITISLAFPPVSHLLAYELINRKHVITNRWIQIWEDPWCQDLVFRSLNTEKAIKRAEKEEARLLKYADEILYVSPITLMHQKNIFKESAHKMTWLPVPTYYVDQNEISNKSEKVWGYFGDYSSQIRNLKPFYNVANELKINVNICGSSDEMAISTEKIKVRPRISLEELKPIEDETNVLVFLSNLHGGQIPGKIYQYSATKKTILFILDGTNDEKEVLKDYFGKFNRYVFCENTEESIRNAILEIEAKDSMENETLSCFSSETIVNHILNRTEV